MDAEFVKEKHMNNTQRLKAFKKDLKELLDRYEADIDYVMEGDTHGIYEDWLGVKFLEPLKEGNRFRGWSELYPLEQK